MLRRPHPDDFTVTIEERPDGSWLVRVNEAPEFCGEGPTLGDALNVIRQAAMAPLTRLGVSEQTDAWRGMAALKAAEEWAEDYLDAKDSEAAKAEPGENVPLRDFLNQLDR